MKVGMKMLSLLLWVTQFGFSVLFPMCFFLLSGTWLQRQFGFGMWIIGLSSVLGILTTISTARSCIRSLRKAAEEASDQKEHPISFNEHE